MRYIVALDVGTTTVRCHVIDEKIVTVGTATEKVELLYPKPGFVEIDPDQLWKAILKVMKNVIRESGVDPNFIAALGITTQRSTFTSWNIETGEHYHRFITWKDLRADSMVKEWNASLTLKLLRFGSLLLYTLTRRKRFLVGSIFKLMNAQITLRLAWALKHVAGLREAATSGKAVFGGVDSWLLYKLTGRHITDVSSASATGLYDPFTMSWASWGMNLFELPSSIFPEVVDSAGKFGHTPKHIFGKEVPITCSMADQAASLFGSGCFRPGDLKVTMGTGTFVDVNTGEEPHASLAGLYPLVGWRIGDELVYVVEGASNDTGTFIEWTKSLGFINEPDVLSDMAHSVKNSDGIYFVPAFSGLQAPINDATAAAGFLGIKPTSGRAHLARSLLESLVFRILLIYDSLRYETSFTYDKIHVDGGVSRNDFMMQLLADLTELKVERSTSSEMAILGVAFLAGLQCGIWKCKEDLLEMRKVDTTFYPDRARREEYQPIFREWKRAVDRFKQWY